MALARLLAVLLVLSPLAAAAQQVDGYVAIEKRLTPEQLQSVGLTDAQLARLNALLAQAQVAAPMHAAANAGNATGAMRDAGLDSAPIETRVRGPLSGWAPGTVFDFDNGQQWKVLKGTVRLSKPVESPKVRLVPGIAGRWFLELDEDHPKARVYRVD